MSMKEFIRSRLAGAIPQDLLATIETTVQKYENQQLASTASGDKMEWMIVGTADIMTFMAAKDREELRRVVRGVVDNPNSVEWLIDDSEDVNVLCAIGENGDVEELERR